METRINFADRLCAAIKKKKSVLCVGLDPQLRYMPPHLIRQAVKNFGVHGPTDFAAIAWLFKQFFSQIIDVVCDVAVCVKPNTAFFESYGAVGIDVLEKVIAYAKSKGLLVIVDAKRGDGGDTVEAYADGYLGQVPFFSMYGDPTLLMRVESPVRADCMTIHAYIGQACVDPFIKRIVQHGTGAFVVVKTSFKPDSAVEQLPTERLTKVWQEMARMVQEWGPETTGASGLRSLGAVAGSTFPEEAIVMRGLLPDSFLLKPGFGRQGAGADDAVIGVRKDGFGIVVNSSREILYAWMKGKYQCA